MSYVKPGFKLCVCDGRYEGCDHAHPCAVPVLDDSWGPWCADCNPRRMESLHADFVRLHSGTPGQTGD